MVQHDRVHFSKMVASLIPVLGMLTSPPLDGLLSPDPTDADDPRRLTDTGAAARAPVRWPTSAWIR